MKKQAKTASKKLSLSKTTLRALTSQALEQVVGGMIKTTAVTKCDSACCGGNTLNEC